MLLPGLGCPEGVLLPGHRWLGECCFARAGRPPQQHGRALPPRSPAPPDSGQAYPASAAQGHAQLRRRQPYHGRVDQGFAAWPGLAIRAHAPSHPGGPYHITVELHHSQAMLLLVLLPSLLIIFLPSSPPPVDPVLVSEIGLTLSRERRTPTSHLTTETLLGGATPTLPLTASSPARDHGCPHHGR